MAFGKRPINISLGGSTGGGSGLGTKSNPLERNDKPPPMKSALGFEDSGDEDTTSGPPQRKLIKLDHNQDTNAPSGRGDMGDDEEDAFSNLMARKTSAPPPPLKALVRNNADEDEDDVFSRFESKQAPPEGKIADTKDKDEEEEEDDPLDAFMAVIDTQVQQEASKPAEEKIRRDDIEDEDYVESYMKHMKKKGIAIGQGGPVKDRDEDADSDEEVYATARAIDNATDAQYDPDDVPYDFQANTKKEITPLSRMDHSKQEYIEIEKCFYEEHEDIARLSEEQVRQIRMDLDMRVSGVEVAKPCISFAHFGFEEALMETIRRVGYSEPSGIQRQAIPVALSGRDIIGIAKTGSGKTAAFLLPMIVHIMDQQELQKGDGPIGVILAPTRELADQIYSEAKRFGKAYGLRVAVVYGGASKQDQFKTLRAGVEILVAAPGRLIDMIKMKATNFRRTSFLVLDEADRVFDFGFEPQVRSICDSIRPDRQTLLFSATFQKRVERLAREVMTDPVRISIGNVGQINSDVTQDIQILKDDTLKWRWLMSRLQEFEALGSVLIFVSRKNGVVELTENLKKAGVKCECLHGDMQQQERDKAIHDFKNKTFPTLVATDVAARGLDIKSIRTVVNFDVARDIDSHVHRVGRTGRAGEKGTAYTLITEKDDRFAGELVRNLEEFDQPVAPEVVKIAMQNPRFRKSRQFMGGNRGGRGGRGGRDGGRGGRGGRGGSRGGGRGSGRGGGSGGGRFHPDGARENSYSSASNNIPLGQGHRNDRHQQDHSESGYRREHAGRPSGPGDGHRGAGSGYRVSGFQPASRPETGAMGTSTPSSTPDTLPKDAPSAISQPNSNANQPSPASATATRPPHSGFNSAAPPPPPPAASTAGPRPPPSHYPPPPRPGQEYPPFPPHSYPSHPPPPRSGPPQPPGGFPGHAPPPGYPFRPPPPPGMFNNQPPPQHPQHPPPHFYRPPHHAYPPHPQDQHGRPGPPPNAQGPHQNHADRRRRWDQ